MGEAQAMLIDCRAFCNAANNCSGGSALLTKAFAPAAMAARDDSGSPLSTMIWSFGLSLAQVIEQCMSLAGHPDPRQLPVQQHQIRPRDHCLAAQMLCIRGFANGLDIDLLLQQEPDG